MKFKLGVFCTVLLALFVLVGCAPEATMPTAPEEEAASEATAEDQAEAEESSDDNAPSGLKVRAPITSDEDIIATMTCEEFDATGLEKLHLFGLYDRAVYVEVGEVEGATWWVVMAENTGRGEVIRDAFLTDALELDDFSDGMWIKISGDDGWRNVDWDDDMLTRGQSALVLAKRTLDGY